MNVYSHCFCAVVTFELCKNDVKNLGKSEDEEAEEEKIEPDYSISSSNQVNDQECVPLSSVQV